MLVSRLGKEKEFCAEKKNYRQAVVYILKTEL